MANHSETKAYTHKTSDGKVTIQMVIGDGQAGGWSLQCLGKTHKGSKSKTISLGDAAALRGANIQVNYIVLDVRAQHDRLSATTTITAGGKAKQYRHSKAGNKGDTATFTTVVMFQ